MTMEQKLWIWGKTLARAARPFLLYLLMPGLCMSVGYVITGSDMDAREFFVYGSNFYTALGMLLSLYLFSRLCRRRGTTLNAEIGYRPEQINIKKGGGAFAFGLASAVTVSVLLTLFPFRGFMSSYSQASARMYEGRDLCFAIVTTVLLAPVLEEVVFRGFMLNCLLQGFSERAAVVLIGILFAICHGNPVWVLYAFVMGVLMAKMAMKEDNIFYCICLHSGFNAPSVLVYLIRVNPAAEQAAFGSKLLIGGYGVIAAAVMVFLYKKYRREGFR